LLPPRQLIPRTPKAIIPKKCTLLLLYDNDGSKLGSVVGLLIQQKYLLNHSVPYHSPSPAGVKFLDPGTRPLGRASAFLKLWSLRGAIGSRRPVRVFQVTDHEFT